MKISNGKKIGKRMGNYPIMTICKGMIWDPYRIYSSGRKDLRQFPQVILGTLKRHVRHGGGGVGGGGGGRGSYFGISKFWKKMIIREIPNKKE